MSKIIKGNLAKAVDFRKIETIKFPVIEVVEETDTINGETAMEDVLQDAHSQKKAILLAAQKEAQLLREQAIEEGYQKGYTDGFEQGKQNIRKMEKEFRIEFDSITRNFHDVRQQLLTQAGKDVQEIALFITKKMIGDLIDQKKDIVLDLYKMLLPSVSDKDITEIVTNPQDNDIMEDYLKFINKANEIKMSISPEISKGSIKVITDQGYIVQDLNNQVDELITELRKLNG